MANNNRYRASGYSNSNYGERENDRNRYSRSNQYESDYGQDEYNNGNSYDNNRRRRRYDEDYDEYNRRINGNRAQGNYGNSGYGNAGGNYGYGGEYNRNRRYDEDYNEDYGTSSYGYGNQYNRNNNYENYSGQGNRDWWDKTKDEVSSWFGDEDAERRRRMDKKYGQHRGRGPKGYTRSDERIRDDINDRLSDDSFLDATEIEVHVAEGEVTLTGTVDNRLDKRRAEDLAEQISGVKNVQNQLRVKLPSGVNGLKNEYQG